MTEILTPDEIDNIIEDLSQFGIEEKEIIRLKENKIGELSIYSDIFSNIDKLSSVFVTKIADLLKDNYNKDKSDKSFKYSILIDEIERHIHSWFWAKEDVDKKTNCHHLALAIWYLLILLNFEHKEEYYTKYDDRSFKKRT